MNSPINRRAAAQMVRVGAVIGILVAGSFPLSAQRTSRRVYVNVTDTTGASVRNALVTEFEVTENGRDREVLRVAMSVPMRILLLVDTSSAMSQMINHFRSGLTAFIAAAPETAEIGLVTTGGQLRPRVTPALDRSKVLAAARGLTPDDGVNAFLDSLLEADRRFLVPTQANSAWPVLVILTTDNGESLGQFDDEAFNRLVRDFVGRGASAHAIVVRGRRSGNISELAQILVDNLGGSYDSIVVSSAVPTQMRFLGERVSEDFILMTDRYEVEYATDAESPGTDVGVRFAREGVTLQVSAYRPF